MAFSLNNGITPDGSAQFYKWGELSEAFAGFILQVPLKLL